MEDRKTVLAKAVDECLREMYARSQPMADYDNIVEEYRTGKIRKDEPVYDRHYLSQDEYKYVVEKYVNKYNIKSHWKDDIEVLEEYLHKGGHKDKYIEDWDDEHGHHPGYRSYEDVPPLKEQILAIMKDFDCSDAAAEVGEKIYNRVMETITNCKDYYRFDREEDDFRATIALGASPTSNPDTVRKWWKENYNVDVEITEHNPLLLWEQDYYGDEFEEVMIDEYGENWKEHWAKEWELEKQKRKEEQERRHKEFIEKYGDKLDNKTE